MKRIIIAIVSILAFTLIAFCAVRFATFWWTVLRDPQRPEFATPTGSFLSEPEAHLGDSMLTITWATRDEYQVNSIYFKKRWSRFVYDGGWDVDVQYDATTKRYNYSTQFELGLPATHGPDGYSPYIEPGIYTYQVFGSTVDHSKKIVSPVLDLDVSM